MGSCVGVGGGGGIESVDLAGALVGAEEEKLSAADGAAQRDAELVLFERRRGGGEEVTGLEVVVAIEFPRATVPGIGA